MTNLAHPPRQDFETRLGNEEHDALRLWLRIMTCTNLVESEIRARLRSRFDSTLPRFDLMSQLWRHPEGLKMGEVSRRLMVTSGNVTGITDQLVREGLISREAVTSDRRAFLIKLTTAGRRSFQRMAEEHEQWIVDLFGGLDDSDTRQLHRLLGLLKQSLTRPDAPSIRSAHSAKRASR